MPGLIESVPMTSVSCDDDFGVPDAEYWCFLDESGTPDYDPDSKPYFAFGSAVFEGDHGDEYMKVLRARASRTGVQGGFHASHDSNDTKQCFFECIGGMDVKFNATFMAKQRAYPYVKAKGNLWLYKWTLYTHTGALVRQLWDGKSRIVVHLVVAKINLSKRERAVKDAVCDVCAQFDREQVHVVPHIWDSNSSAGLQVVDYGLWAIQRHVLSGGIKSGHYNRFVQPKMADDVWYPWGTVAI